MMVEHCHSTCLVKTTTQLYGLPHAKAKVKSCLLQKIMELYNTDDNYKWALLKDWREFFLSLTSDRRFMRRLGNVKVLAGNKPLPDPVLTQIHVAIYYVSKPQCFESCSIKWIAYQINNLSNGCVSYVKCSLKVALQRVFCNNCSGNTHDWIVLFNL